MKNSAGEREELTMTAKEEIKLIDYLKKIGWSAEEILKLIEYIRR